MMRPKPKKDKHKDRLTAYQLAHLATILEAKDHFTNQAVVAQFFYFRRARDLYAAAAQYLENNDGP